jgi:mRNA interferase MazF
VVSEVRLGEVYWLDLGDALRAGPADRHPCIVVQGDVFNRSEIGTTVVCIVTSNLQRGLAPGNVILEEGEAGLSRARVVNVSQLMTVDKKELEELVGRVSAKSLRAVLSGVNLLFERN